MRTQGKPRMVRHGGAGPGGRSLASAFLLSVLLVGKAGAQTPIPPDAKDFAAAMAGSDQYEIMAATVALAQSKSPDVQAFARDMIRNHQQMDEALRRAAEASRLPPPPPAMSGDQAGLLAGLQGVAQTEFDKTYVAQQVLAHTQAVTVGESFASAGGDPNLRQAAKTALPTIREHLARAQQLQAEVGK